MKALRTRGMIRSITALVLGLTPGALWGQARPADDLFKPSGVLSPWGLVLRLTRESVQEELKMTEEQKAKAKSGVAKVQSTPRGAGRSSTPIYEASEKLVKEILTDAQQKRFAQINVQFLSFDAFAGRDVVQALGLTEDQKDRIRALAVDRAKESAALSETYKLAQQNGVAGEDLSRIGVANDRKRVEISQQYAKKAVELLTADQKKVWMELTGEPFDITKR